MQLAEMDHSDSVSASASKSTVASHEDLSGSTRRSTDSLATGVSATEEDDKERAIAKAALSIAELSQSLR